MPARTSDSGLLGFMSAFLLPVRLSRNDGLQRLSEERIAEA
jgi:hypothetical protein